MWIKQIDDDLAQVTIARHEALEYLGAEGVHDRLSDVAVVVSELVTNALRYGSQPVTALAFATSDRVHVRVEDASQTSPQVRERSLDAVGGRGLQLVAAIASSWGVQPREPVGKFVWAEFDLTA